MRHEMIENFSATGMLRNEVNRIFRFHHLIEPRNVRMMQELQDGDLSIRFCEVVFIEAGLVNDLDGNLRGEESKSSKDPITCAPRNETTLIVN
jgi:hypothetical protein